jgi:pimeloyl-ACP methyl ester carboxylesterase
MIYYSKSGTGTQTLVLVHGFCENSTCFSEQVFFLSRHFTVITPDLPGFGHSPADSSSTMERMADSLYEVLVAEKIPHCIMIGHSMGGYVTLAFANKYPELLTGFGLIHSTALPDTDERKAKRDQAIRLIAETGAEKYVTNFIPPLFAPSFNNKEVINLLIREGLRTSAEGLIYALKAMRERNGHTQLLSRTRLPVFFGVGKLDSIIPEKDMLQQASTCKKSQVCYLTRSAHMGYIEESQKVNSAIEEFVRFCS